MHVALVAVALVVLPVAVPGDARPPESGNPVFWQLGLMALTIGLPFFALASSAPLVQRWLSHSGHHRRRRPLLPLPRVERRSIAGLIAYPVLIEPLLGLDAQGKWWTAGYVLLVVLMATCAVFVLRAARAGTRSSRRRPRSRRSRSPGSAARAGWRWPSCPRR